MVLALSVQRLLAERRRFSSMLQQPLRTQASRRPAFTLHSQATCKPRACRPRLTVSEHHLNQQGPDSNSCVVTLSQMRNTATKIFMSLSLSALCYLPQPAPALADAPASMPPAATSSSSIASQAASRTVVDVVSGENSVLNEQNAPDNRQTPNNPPEEKTDPIADTSEASSLANI